MNPNISQLISTTLANQAPKMVDNISENNALFFKLKEKGRISKESGGFVFRETLAYAKNSTVKAQGEYEYFNVTPQDVITSVDFDHKIVTGTFTMSELEIRQNNSKEQIIPLMKSKMEILRSSFKNKFGSLVYSDGTGDGGHEPAGLQHLVSENPTVGTVGGINRATNKFWRNQVFSFKANQITATQSNILDAMNQMYRNCQNQSGQITDLIVAGHEYYKLYENALQALQRFTTGKMAAAGFDSYRYKAADVVFDPKCSDTKMYFLNTSFLGYKYLGNHMFSVGQALKPYNQGVSFVPVIAIGNFTLSNAKTQGVIIE